MPKPTDFPATFHHFSPLFFIFYLPLPFLPLSLPLPTTMARHLYVSNCGGEKKDGEVEVEEGNSSAISPSSHITKQQ